MEKVSEEGGVRDDGVHEEDSAVRGDIQAVYGDQGCDRRVNGEVSEAE